MASDPSKIHAETDDARAGSTPNVVRWILAISLLAVIVLLSIVWITGALTQGDQDKEASVSSQLAEQRREAEERRVPGEEAGKLEAPQASDTAPSGLATTEN
ncbi:MAG: hypothetical protein J0I69_07470 [Altererythrobacter sp.]|nr:hypothetical protein [Altererythrobacter sp.]OJU60826.1 MAG: hypothetical protein BGO08_11830 [Altererythrobacter sp. 66-12]